MRNNDKLKAYLEEIGKLKERFWKHQPDRQGRLVRTRPLMFSRQLRNMLMLARGHTAGALTRDESRGAHYKPDFPERDDPTVPEDHDRHLTRRTGPGSPTVRSTPT